MKVAVNLCYGNFVLSDRVEAELHDWVNYADHSFRSSPPLVNAIERHGTDYCSTDSSIIGLAYIPNNATDYEIVEFEGFESIIAVVNGKIVHIDGHFIDEGGYFQ